MSVLGDLGTLPLHVEGYELERLQRDVSSDFTRVSTHIRLHGDGEEGIGEDVTYDAEDQDACRRPGPSSRSTASGRSTRSAITSRRSTSGRGRRCARRACSIAAGRTNRRRWTSR
jgi:hypothetical protein